MLVFNDPRLEPICEAISRVASDGDHSFAFGFNKDGFQYRVSVDGKSEPVPNEPATPPARVRRPPIIATEGDWLVLGRSLFLRLDSITSFQFEAPGQLTASASGCFFRFQFAPEHRAYVEEKLQLIFEGFQLDRRPAPPPANYEETALG